MSGSRITDTHIQLSPVGTIPKVNGDLNNS